MSPDAKRGPATGPRPDQPTAKQSDQSEGYNGTAQQGPRWVRLRDTNTMAEAIVNLEHVVRIVHAPRSDFVQVVLRDGSFVDIWQHGTDHDELMSAVAETELAAS